LVVFFVIYDCDRATLNGAEGRTHGRAGEITGGGGGGGP